MLVQVVDQLGMMMLKITEAVMRFSPIAVFTAIASIIATKGLGILMTFAKFIGMFYLGLATLWSVLILAGFIFLGPRIFSLIKMIRAPFLLSFMTASSEAAFPQMLTALDKFGVGRRISSFVLPLGYSFNLDGTMVYCTFTILFIAQAYGIALPIETQITMLLMLMVTSKGIAGVPRASLVVIAATLAHFNLPEAGLLMIDGYRHLHGYGAIRDQCRGELHRMRGRGEVGGRIGCAKSQCARDGNGSRAARSRANVAFSWNIDLIGTARGSCY